MNELALVFGISIAAAHILAFLWIWLSLRVKHHPSPALRKWRMTGIAPPIEDCPDDEIETFEYLTAHTKDLTKTLKKANEAMTNGTGRHHVGY